MNMRHRDLWLMAALALAISACSTGGLASHSASSTTPAADNFYLYVSNQSFEHPSISVDVEIDHARVVSQTFEVGNQHNFIVFSLSLQPGEHLLGASASDGTTTSGTLVIPAGAARYGTLFYWADADTPPLLDLKVTEEEPGFG